MLVLFSWSRSQHTTTTHLGRDYYGPDGVYPFAGRECARALAKFSTDEQDCVDKVDDLTVMERDQLENWIVRFRFKYPVVGHIVD